MRIVRLKRIFLLGYLVGVCLFHQTYSSEFILHPMESVSNFFSFQKNLLTYAVKAITGCYHMSHQNVVQTIEEKKSIPWPFSTLPARYFDEHAQILSKSRFQYELVCKISLVVAAVGVVVLCKKYFANPTKDEGFAWLRQSPYQYSILGAGTAWALLSGITSGIFIVWYKNIENRLAHAIKFCLNPNNTDPFYISTRAAHEPW